MRNLPELLFPDVCVSLSHSKCVWCLSLITCNVSLDISILESYSSGLVGREPQHRDGGGGGVQEEQEKTGQEGDHPHPGERERERVVTDWV